MKDIHCHILYGVDDGPKTKDESLKLINELYNNGVTEICASSHYIIGSNYNCNNKIKQNIISDLKWLTKMNIYISNEVFIDNDIYKYIKKDEISTINNSRYILIELPLNEKIYNYEEILFELISKGYVPIIAHPERYLYLTTSELEDLINLGCLFQGNIASLIGKYGKDSEKKIKTLLKKHMIHIMATDSHHVVNNLDKCRKKLKKLVNNNMYEDLLENNFDKIINDQKIEVYDIC